LAFESGSVSFRMFEMDGGLPRDYVRRFAAHAPPPLETLGREPIGGWVTGRHLLDSVINDETAHLAGYLRLTLMKAEKRIPEALLRAECRMEELAEMQENGGLALKRQKRIEIRREVMDRLFPAMPPTLTGLPMVYDPQHSVLYVGATSAKQADAFLLAFREATGKAPSPVTPDTAALRRKGVNVRDLASTSFSPELEDELAGDGIGQDFLTWLWFFSEVRGGLLPSDGGDFGVMIEGPLTFVLEGSGAHEAVLRKGAPPVSAEAKTSLLSGKKLKQAVLTLARGHDVWRCGVDADEFVFRGLRLPQGEPLDFTSRFQERMLALHAFQDAFFRFYDLFLDERGDAVRWKKTQKEIHAWVSNRAAQR
jgi:hypothetical protein